MEEKKKTNKKKLAPILIFFLNFSEIVRATCVHPDRCLTVGFSADAYFSFNFVEKVFCQLKIRGAYLIQKCVFIAKRCECCSFYSQFISITIFYFSILTNPEVRGVFVYLSSDLFYTSYIKCVRLL